MTSPTHSKDALAALWRHADQPAVALEAVDLTGAEPVLPSTFAVGTAAQTTIAASALAASELWRLGTGRQQRVSVPMRDAAIEFRSERYLRIAGKPAPELWDKIAGLYCCGDGRFVRLHTNFPHHRDGVLKLLGCAHDRAAVQKALDGWKAEDFETAAAEAGLVVTATRSFAEWDAHPQGQALAAMPAFSIEKIGDAPPQPLPSGDRPLSGVRVLDLTRVIAGPVCGRTLAAHGADVMLVTAAHLPQMMPLVVDNGRGKLSTSLDLRAPGGRETLSGLLRDADIFVQGYRPGALAHLGLAPEDVARLRPGIVYVTLSAFGDEGPWRARRGFETIIQSVSGMAHEQGIFQGGESPRHLPAQVVDHGTGYLAAFGAMIALARRAREGGSYLVRVSLAQTGRWVDALGRVDGRATPDLTLEAVQDLLADMDSPYGRLRHVLPA